uniref:Pre-mRNA splicing Prp18-interacting factor n=1 Tax=Tanacetum cinerariifolium TaxID=118510 RepID=A0A6L2L7C3_TANCI|nr:hypothetical protein [Tanacetum cinerariifolium]
MSAFVLCVGCGEPLYGFSPCRWCTCEWCGNDLLDGICSLCNSRNSCIYDPNSNSFDCPPDSYHPSHPTYETYLGDSCENDSHFGYDCPPQFPLNYEVFKIKDAFGNKQYKLEDIQELFRKLFNDVKNIHEELAEYINTPSWNRPTFYNNGNDDDEDYSIAITPGFLITNSLSMGDEHLDTVLAMESDKFIKSSVENLVPNPSEFEGENECDVPACFTTFSNILFDADYDFHSSDDQLFFDEDFLKEIYSNHLFDEEIIPIKIDPYSFNVESDHIESMLNHDSSIIISSKIDFLFDEFANYPMSSGIEDDGFDSKREILIFENLPRKYTLSLPEKESFHFHIPSFSCPPAKPPDGNTGILNIKMMGDISEKKVPMPRLMITLVPNQEKSPVLLYHQGLEAFLHSTTFPRMILGKNNPLLDVFLFHFYPP